MFIKMMKTTENLLSKKSTEIYDNKYIVIWIVEHRCQFIVNM